MGFIMLSSLETDHLLHEAEVAKILSIKVSTLRRWRWAGEGPKFIKIGAAVRYDPQALKDYLAGRVRTSTSDVGPQSATV
jgi:predicted DNA-binding transcriptional regulator AlpA